jgi:hypothetical protein
MVFRWLDPNDNECWSRLDPELSVPKSLERVVVNCHFTRDLDHCMLGDGEAFFSLFGRAKKFGIVCGQHPAGFWTTQNSSDRKAVVISKIQELSLYGHRGGIVPPLDSFR